MIYGGEVFDDFGKGLHRPFSATVLDLKKVLKAPMNEGDDDDDDDDDDE